MTARCWVMHSDPYVKDRVSDFMHQPGGMRILNETEWKDSIPDIDPSGGRVSRFAIGCLRLPEGFPLLEMNMPIGDWPAPDFFNINILTFVSARMRSVLRLSGDVVQYLPIKLAAAGPLARAQDYRLLRVLPHQPAIDLSRSKYHVGGWTEDDGTKKEFIIMVTSLALRADLSTRSELFWADEVPVCLLATDALAERVMKAGCTGVQFDDPATTGVLNGMIRIRTADGVAERFLG